MFQHTNTKETIDINEHIYRTGNFSLLSLKRHAQYLATEKIKKLKKTKATSVE